MNAGPAGSQRERDSGSPLRSGGGGQHQRQTYPLEEVLRFLPNLIKHIRILPERLRRLRRVLRRDTGFGCWRRSGRRRRGRWRRRRRRRRRARWRRRWRRSAHRKLRCCRSAAPGLRRPTGSGSSPGRCLYSSPNVCAAVRQRSLAMRARRRVLVLGQSFRGRRLKTISVLDRRIVDPGSTGGCSSADLYFEYWLLVGGAGAPTAGCGVRAGWLSQPAPLSISGDGFTPEAQRSVTWFGPEFAVHRARIPPQRRRFACAHF